MLIALMDTIVTFLNAVIVSVAMMAFITVAVVLSIAAAEKASKKERKDEMKEKNINRNPMIVQQRKEIRQTIADISKARNEGKIRKACDLGKKLNRQKRDLKAAIYHLIDAGWINE